MRWRRSTSLWTRRLSPAAVSGTGGPISYNVVFGYTGPFTATPRGLIPATTFPGSVSDGKFEYFSVVVPAGTTYARFSLFDANVSPASIIFNNSTQPYVIQTGVSPNAFGIAGGTSLAMFNNGSLTLATPNTYSGGTFMNAGGTLVLNNATALGTGALTIAVGGKSSLYYLPMAIADRLGYFKAEGLNVESADFAGEPHHVERLVFEFATGWFGSRADGR